MRPVPRFVPCVLFTVGLLIAPSGGVNGQPAAADSPPWERLAAPPRSGDAAGLSASRVQFSAPEKIDLAIQEAVASIDRHRRAPGTEDLAVLSTELVRVTPSGEIHAYVMLTEARPEYVARLESLGLRVELVLPDFALVQGWAPAASIDALSAQPFVKQIRAPGYAVRQAAGAVSTQGEAVLRADAARTTLGLTGVGVKVGVISDGVAHREAVAESGDLPAGIQVLRAGTGGEGTAMLEIVHDLAPGVSLAFFGPTTSADMVAGINALAAAGARVIVDDLLFFDEPKFEDGMIGQAARAFATGGIYVTAAGNGADTHYQAPYRRMDSSFDGGGRSYTWFHNHAAAGIDIGNTFTLPAFCAVRVELQWNNRFGAASDDFDLFLARSSDGRVLAASHNAQTGSQDPRESLVYATGSTPVTVFVAIAEFSVASDPASMLLDYLVFLSCPRPIGILEYSVAEDSIRGHAAVPEVLSVAAVRATAPTVIQPYSSRGPATIQFPAPESRSVPALTAVDCVATRAGQLGFFASPFCGTSAAAPHVAGVAAMLLAKPGISPEQVRSVLRGSAVDLGSPGLDFTFGAGRVDALAAAQAALSSGPVPGGLSGAAVLPGSRAGRVPAPTPGCLPGVLPSTPVPPVVSRDVVWGFTGADRMRFDVWRHPCQDGSGSYPLIRVTPQSASPFLCYLEFTIVQGDAEFDVWLTSSASATAGFCGDLLRATTFVLRPDPLGADYDLNKPFTLVFDGLATTYSLPVPGEPARGTVLTAFATVIAAPGGPALGCAIVPETPVPAAFSYQTTDPATNLPVGAPNTPADVPAGGVKTFVIAFTPAAPFPPTDVRLAFDCANTRTATVVSGLNTLLLSASATPVADIVALASTPGNDGILAIPGASGTGVFAVATVNIGAAGPITVTADSGGVTASGPVAAALLPVAVTLCQTDPATGGCLANPTPTVTTQIDPGQTPTFAVFVKASGTVPFEPGVNRITVRFQDAGGAIRGATSVAVRTQ